MLKRILDQIFGHVITICIVAGLVYFYLRCIGRVKYIGRKNLPKKGKVIYYANHPSMMDPFLVLELFFWRSFFRPSKLPWSPVAKENYYPEDSKRVPILKNIPYIKNLPVLAWLCRHTHGIPIERDRRDNNAVNQLCDKLSNGENVFIFPEGKRTEPGSDMSDFNPGIAIIFCRSDVEEVVPIKVVGSDQVLPRGAGWPNWKKGRVKVIVGEPITDLLRAKKEALGLDRSTTDCAELSDLLKIFKEELKKVPA
jgi:1-acyl-sn-glycerol-3-phosphate acyltransferase